MVPAEWFIEKYEFFGDWYGLKCANPHDGRGVPEGTRAQWLELIAAMRADQRYSSKRLAYDEAWGCLAIYSPRNTNRGNTPGPEEFVVSDPAAVADWLEAQL